jgi:type II secretory pathway component PulF
MLFFKRLSLDSLIEMCRILRHNLGAGLTLRRVFRQQTEKGPLAVRPVAERISRKLDSGKSLEAALLAEKAYFPPMFVSMAIVGEQTGCLPEVFRELEKYFLLLQKLRRDFIMAILWPAFCFVLFPFVIAGMIFILYALTPGKPFDPIGFGYTGRWGAPRFLIHFWGSVAFLVVLYLVATRVFKQALVIHEILLNLWVIGPCVRAIALMRFCMSINMTMETGMPITEAVELSMRATGNPVFDARAEVVGKELHDGEDFTVALKHSRIFPEDFLNILANAEEGGRTPEVMEQQADFYADEARRRLTILSRVASGLIYLFVACLLVFMIFRIFFSIYGAGGPYDPKTYGLPD